jgi:hypothetical protein
VNILIACEESGRVRDAFRAGGHNPWSCDLLPTAAPGPHVQGDVLDILGLDWDMCITFPPCTDLALSGARYWAEKRADGRQQRAVDFFMAFARSRIPRLAIENPVGVMSKLWRKPDQIIHPYQFGDPWRKTTCLWLAGLPPLRPTNVVEFQTRMQGWNGTLGPERQRLRSQTYPGIAKAMAEQWG